jgi:hypothetical protein
VCLLPWYRLSTTGTGYRRRKEDKKKRKFY